jgi:hypothetical protein
VARISSGTVVAGLTAGALAVVCVLAVQASGSASKDRAGSTPTPGASSSHPAHVKPRPPAVPRPSGQGKRVVYSLSADRVWLVDGHGRLVRTFRVRPSAVDPVPNSYKVYSRSARTIGSDGVPIEHVVRFASLGPTVIGFSAAINRSMPTPLPSKHTGGVRETRADGAAMWKFAVVGVKVVVVE